MAKNRKKYGSKNNDRFDEQIEHLFMVETKKANKRKQEQGNEKKPKTLNELVENYSHILYPIEFAIASHYVENPSITDKMLLKVIMSLVKEYRDGQRDVGSVVWKKTKTGNVVDTNSPRSTTIAMESKLGKALKQAAIEGLLDGPITREEFILCLRYVVYCIDNRSWIRGGRGYLDWISNWFGLLGSGKKQEFDIFYDELSQVIGIEKSFLKGETLYEDES